MTTSKDRGAAPKVKNCRTLRLVIFNSRQKYISSITIASPSLGTSNNRILSQLLIVKEIVNFIQTEFKGFFFF